MSQFNYRLPEKCCSVCSNAYLSTYGDAQCKLLVGIVIDAGGVCDWYDVSRDSIPLEIRKGFNPPLAPLVSRKHVTSDVIEEIVPIVGTCSTCQASTYKGTKPYCILLCKTIKPDGRCKDYIEEVTNDTDNNVDSDSNDSNMDILDMDDIQGVDDSGDDNTPDSGDDDSDAGNNDTGDVDNNENEVVHECQYCKHSFMQGDTPWCSNHDQEIDPLDICDDWTL